MTFFFKRLWGKMTGKKKAKKAARKNKRAASRELKRQKKYIREAKKGKTLRKTSPFTKPQNKLVDWLTKSVTGEMAPELDIKKDPTYKAGQDYLQKILSGDPRAIEAFEAPARREFREQIMPEIAEQYAGAGAGRSSAFGTAAAGAGASLAEQLANMRAQLGMGALPQALQYAEQPIQNQAGLMGQVIGKQPAVITERPYMSAYRPGDIPETHGSMIGGTIGAIGGGLATGGNPAGMYAGWNIGQAIGGASTDVQGSEGNYAGGLSSMMGALAKGFGSELGAGLGRSPAAAPQTSFPTKYMETTPFAATMATS